MVLSLSFIFSSAVLHHNNLTLFGIVCCLQSSDIELGHLQHRLDHAICPVAIFVLYHPQQGIGHDLPGQSVFVLQPATNVRCTSGGSLSQ